MLTGIKKIISISVFLVGFMSFTNSHAANVAFYNDPAVVDSAQEGANLRATMVTQGHTVTDITLSTLAAFTAGLTGRTILVIPEQQNADLNATIDAPTRALIDNFVNNGGTVQVHGGAPPRDSNFLNGVFGYTIAASTGAAGAANRTAAAAATPFAGGPATLLNNSAVNQVTAATLPAGAVNVYSPDGGVSSTMFFAPRGAGRVVFMGWDWFDAPPQGVSDGGWLGLAGLVASASAASVATAVSAVPTVSEWAMLLLAGLMVAVAAYKLRPRATLQRNPAV